MQTQAVNPFHTSIMTTRGRNRFNAARVGLIGGMAGTAGLLLISTIAALLWYFCFRRNRVEKHAFVNDVEKGPTNLAAPVKEDKSLTASPSTTEPAPTAGPQPGDDLERPTQPSRVPTVVPGPSTVPSRRATQQQSAAPPTGATTPPVEPTLPSTDPAASPPQATPSTQPEDTPTLAQRSTTVPTNDLQRAPTAPPEDDINTQSDPDQTARKPSLIKRKKSTFHNKGDSVDAADREDKDEAATPPPRVATLPPPSRAPTAAVPPPAAGV